MSKCNASSNAYYIWLLFILCCCCYRYLAVILESFSVHSIHSRIKTTVWRIWFACVFHPRENDVYLVFRAVEMLRKRELIIFLLSFSPTNPQRHAHIFTKYPSDDHFNISSVAESKAFHFLIYKNNEIHLNKFSLIIDANTLRTEFFSLRKIKKEINLQRDF